MQLRIIKRVFLVRNDPSSHGSESSLQKACLEGGVVGSLRVLRGSRLAFHDPPPAANQTPGETRAYEDDCRGLRYRVRGLELVHRALKIPRLAKLWGDDPRQIDPNDAAPTS